jgi:hypothetical protein
MSELEKMVRSFTAQITAQLTAAIDAQALAQARQAVFASLGMGAPVAKRRGRPPKAKAALGPMTEITSIAKKTRKKMPIQLCPVPGCKNKAAPIFGMVCSKHKDVAKSKIKKYREARKAKKEKAAS